MTWPGLGTSRLAEANAAETEAGMEAAAVRLRQTGVAVGDHQVGTGKVAPKKFFDHTFQWTDASQAANFEATSLP